MPELPAWVRDLLCFFAVALFTIPFIEPLFPNEFPDKGDGLLNLYRIMALDHSLRHGDLWPRFLPALNYGFGSPVFHYYGPLSIYGAELIHLLGADFPLAYRLAVMLYSMMGALGAFLFGKALAGRWAGIVTAAAFVYAPPLFDTNNRLGQFAAVMLLPWALWAFLRLATLRRRRDFLLAIIFFAAMPLLHNITAIYAAPLVAAWAVFVAWQTPRAHVAHTARIGSALLAITFAVALTAFFSVPALAEQKYVRLDRLKIPMFDYHNGFLSIDRIFMPPYNPQTGRLGSAEAQAVGWPQLALGIAGLVLLARQQRRWLVSSPHSWALFAVIGLIALVFLATRYSEFVWDYVPFFHLILFPQRLMYGASLMAAMLAGIGAALIAEHIAKPTLRFAWIAFCVTVIIAHDLPNLHTNPTTNPRMESLADLHEFETTTGWLGATSAKEFLPIWVKEIPDPNRLSDRFQKGNVIPRLAEDRGVRIESQSWAPTSADLVLTLDTARTLEFEWFYMPGWNATIDGQHTRVRPTEPHGLIALDVSEGKHRITLQLVATSVQRYANWVSLATLLGLALFLRWRWKLPHQSD